MVLAGRHRHIGHESNEEENALANIGSTCAPIPPRVFLERICESSIKPKAAEKKTSTATDSGATPPNEPMTIDDLELDTGLEGPMSVMMIEQSWTQPYITYLLSKRLPDDPTDARHIARRSKAFAVINDELYKSSIIGVLQ